MKYFFPSFIDSVGVKQEPLPQLKITINSGTNALCFLLKSFKLPLHSKIAIPVFVCDSVKQAVEKEKCMPILFDLKPDNTFWTYYDLEKIREQRIKVIILVHLYGFIHPDTEKITEFCEKNDIKLIHDAAQSYGVNEQLLMRGNGIVYSFGPGKSTTAAGGAWIKNCNENETYFSIKIPSFLSFQNAKAKLFLKTRIFGYRLSKFENILGKVLNNITFNSSGIYRMSSFQLNMASYAVSNIERQTLSRKKRYLLLVEKVKRNSLLQVAYDDNKGLYFKLILFVHDEINKFRAFLEKHNIPYFSLFINTEGNYELMHFKKNARQIIEISCESSIPENEIERVADLLSTYK